MATRRLDDDEKNTLRLKHSIPTRGNPKKIIINEPGLYSLILQSRKSDAKRFQRWITHDVLPSIRKTGRYVAKLDINAAAEELALQVLGYRIFGRFQPSNSEEVSRLFCLKPAGIERNMHHVYTLCVVG